MDRTFSYYMTGKVEGRYLAMQEVLDLLGEDFFPDRVKYDAFLTLFRQAEQDWTNEVLEDPSDD